MVVEEWEGALKVVVEGVEVGKEVKVDHTEAGRVLFPEDRAVSKAAKEVKGG